MRLPELSRFAVAFVALLALTQCVWSPYSGELFSSASSILFEGCSLAPSSLIQIQACPNPDFNSPYCSGSFTTLSLLNAPSTSNYTDSTGTSWYCWGDTVAVPQSYWHPDGPQSPSVNAPASATVRVLDHGLGTDYYIWPAKDCPHPYGMAQENTGDWRCAFPGHSASENIGIVVLASSY